MSNLFCMELLQDTNYIYVAGGTADAWFTLRPLSRLFLACAGVRTRNVTEDLKGDVRTLASDKSKRLHSFAQVQAQYGQAVGRLQIFEQFHWEKTEVSTGKSGEKSNNIEVNITDFKPIDLLKGFSWSVKVALKKCNSAHSYAMSVVTSVL